MSNDKYVYDKVNKREARSWFMDNDGGFWMDSDPCGVDMSGKVRIFKIRTDHPQYEVRTRDGDHPEYDMNTFCLALAKADIPFTPIGGPSRFTTIRLETDLHYIEFLFEERSKKFSYVSVDVHEKE